MASQRGQTALETSSRRMGTDNLADFIQRQERVSLRKGKFFENVENDGDHKATFGKLGRPQKRDPPIPKYSVFSRTRIQVNTGRVRLGKL
jgi:hypothetical protein